MTVDWRALREAAKPAPAPAPVQEPILRAAPREPARETPREPRMPRKQRKVPVSLQYLLKYCSSNPARFKSIHAHVEAVREWLESEGYSFDQ